MSVISTAACIFILSGAAIMAVNIYKFSKLLHIFNQFAVEGYRRFIIFYRIHQLLMLFFLIGYLVVFSATFFQVHIVSEIFVAVIFFLELFLSFLE